MSAPVAKPRTSFMVMEGLLEERFGPISSPIDWFGVNTRGLREALEPFPHVIERHGIFSNPSRSAELMAIAYVTARLVKNRSFETIPDFGVEKKRFGIIASIGSTAATEALLGVPFEDGIVKTDEGSVKGHFVSPQGFCATIRQSLNEGARSSFIVNTEGKAEMAIQEMLPEAQAVVVELTA